MKLPLLFLTLLAPLPLAAVPQKDPLQAGEEALEGELWDIAAMHFSGLLESRPLPPETKSRIAMQLAEAWVRGGKPEQALALLEESFVEKATGRHFWKGQALAGLGQWSEALKELAIETSAPGSAFVAEATLTRAGILLALNQPAEALGLLRTLTSNPDPAIAVGAKLREAEILIDLKQFEEAGRVMPPTSEIPSRLAQQAEFLDASILLGQHKPAEAAARFFVLLDQPAGQTLPRYHAAALGYADALEAQGNRSEASEFLINFVEKNPVSPVLDSIFKRLVDWLPGQPLINDPVLSQLSQWIPNDKPRFSGLISDNDGCAAGGQPAAVPSNDLTAFAMVSRAVGLRRINSPVTRAEAKSLLTRLQFDYPGHFLAPRALLQSARWLLEDGNVDRAFAVLDAVRENAGLTALGGEASFLQARAAYQAGRFEEANTLFDQAAKVLPSPSSQTARLNAAISRFRQTGVMTIALTGTDGKPIDQPELEANLELEQALATTPAEAARTAIEVFLTRHPKHPRVPEARLAAAEAALSIHPPDLSMAKAQLDTIAAEPAAGETLPAPRLALARLRLIDLSKDSAATIAAARAYIETYPDDPSAAEAALTLGRTLYETQSYNDARLVLEKLAANDKDPARAQAAWMIAARSASLVGTPNSREEALGLFDRAAAIRGSLTPFIMMEKARLMIDLNRLPEAVAFIRKWYQSLAPADPDRLPAGLLFGEATYAQGDKNPQALTETLGIYDELLKHPETTPALVNRIQYHRGMILELLPSTADPAVKRESEAFATYYSVLDNSPNPPAEFHFLELSGFRALEILVRAQKWPAAISVAKKIASFNGQRAKDAAARARDIQLKNFIYED